MNIKLPRAGRRTLDMRPVSGLAIAAALLAGPALADTHIDPENPDYGTRVSELEVVAASGAAAAPTVQASLEATQPQSIITRRTIELLVPQTGDYTQVVLLAPSVSGLSFNGPGFYEAKTTLRGFPDGQYNVTYDGIPWGDTNDPTHHSTSFFPSSTIGAAVVDRGPGTAGQMGQATFGGSINLFSPEVSQERGGSQTFNYGSWNSWLSVTKLNTGNIRQLNNARLLLNFQEMGTDGALTNSEARAYNQMARAVLPLSGSWNLTLFGTYNYTRVYQNDSNGATLAQVALYGRNFGLSDNPAEPQYFGYNVVEKHTDFEYARLTGDVSPSIHLEQTLFSYYYNNDTNTATNMTCTPAELAVGGCLGTRAAPTGNRDIPGYWKLNHYRVYGSITRVNFDVPFGQIRAGFYTDHADTHRARYQYDITLNRAPDPRQGAPAQPNPLALANINYDQNSSWNNYQPFIDFEWQVTPDLTITPGLKYVHFTRDVTGPVNQGPRTNIPYSATFSRTLYFLTANYHVRDNLSVYGQFATGFLIPALNTLQVNNPNPSGLQPQESTNYQIGAVFHGSRVTLDADVYYIDFRNKFVACSPQPVPGEINYCTIPGANYRGVEGQITFRANENLDVFANGSINIAETRTSPHTQLASAPRGTAVLGAILHFPQWSLAMADKYVGDQWATEGADARYHIDGYNQLDATLVYNLTPRVRLEAAIYNLFDSQEVTSIKTASIPANPTLVDIHDQYFYQPGRSFQVSARVSF